MPVTGKAGVEDLQGYRTLVGECMYLLFLHDQDTLELGRLSLPARA